MGKISGMIADEEFQRRLKEGRGKAETMMVYRGKGDGHSVDDGEDGRAIAGIDACVEEIAGAVGLKLRSATAFSTALRSTLTLRFALGDLEDDLAIYHDTTTGETQFQIVHPDRIDVDVGSQSEILALHGDPYGILAHHFAAHDAAEVRATLERCGLVPATPSEIRREQVYVLGLREA